MCQIFREGRLRGPPLEARRLCGAEVGGLSPRGRWGWWLEAQLVTQFGGLSHAAQVPSGFSHFLQKSWCLQTGSLSPAIWFHMALSMTVCPPSSPPCSTRVHHG